MPLKALNLVAITTIAAQFGLETREFAGGNIQCQWTADTIKNTTGSSQARALTALEDALVADGYDASQVEIQWSRKDRTTGKVSAWPSCFVNAKPRTPRATTNTATEKKLADLQKSVEMLTTLLATKMGVAVDTAIAEEVQVEASEGPVEGAAEEVAY